MSPVPLRPLLDACAETRKLPRRLRAELPAVRESFERARTLREAQLHKRLAATSRVRNFASD